MKRLVAAVAVVGVLATCWYVLRGFDASSPQRYAAANRQLDDVEVRWYVPAGQAYQRKAFGKGWAVDRGCDMRNRVLARDLIDVRFRGTRDCVVESGLLRDPYTGGDVPFDKSRGSQVDIDHRYPLALAWAYGAREWPSERRAAFANDPANLVAVKASENRSKGRHGPGRWQPARHRCDYVAAFAEQASRWGLAMSPLDYYVSRAQLGVCQRM